MVARFPSNARNTAQAERLIQQASQATTENQANALISQAQAAAQRTGNADLFASVTNRAQDIQANLVAQRPVDTGGGGGGGGGGFDQRAYEERLRAAERAREQRRIAETVKAIFSLYGLGSLNAVIEDYARKDYSAAAIEILLRQTPQYKERFPAMEALMEKKRAITEAAYIEYERTAAGLERQYGLPKDMLMGRVTDLLTNEVSASELNDRVVLAASAAIQAPEDFRQTMRDFYDIDTGGLTAYFLDPQVATPLLEKQYASSIIGAEARRQGVGIDVYGAENLQELGISQQQARTGFREVAQAAPLTEGRGDIVTQGQLISGTFAENEQAQKAVERARGARRGRFQQGGGVLATSGGVAGAGTAATR